MSCTVRCRACGDDYEAQRNYRQGFCQPCRKADKSLRNANYRALQKEIPPAKLQAAIDRKVTSLTVVFDPLGRAGFRPGVVFQKEEWKQMLLHLSFTQGTILKDSKGRLYIFEFGSFYFGAKEK